MQDPRFDIGDFTYGKIEILGLHLLNRLHIGKFCSIGSGVRILVKGWHHNVDWITTYPFASAHMKSEWPGSKEVTLKDPKERFIVIGNDVWIGDSALILSDVTIGDGSVIGAGSVVAKDVPAYSIVAGNPAQVLRMRFSDENINFLLNLKWWDWSKEKIDKHLFILCSDDIQKFKSIVNL